MKYRVLGSFALSALALALTACEKSGTKTDAAAAAPSSELGVVDLDRVAGDLGWIREMQTNLQTVEQQFKNELQAKQDAYGAEVQAHAQRLGMKEGVKATPQQEQDLGQFVLIRRQVIGQLQQAAQQQFANYRAEWVKRYREALDPIVRDVASARKVRVVMTRTDTVMYIDPVADLSAAVTDAAKAHPPMLAQVPMPTLPSVGDLPAPGATQPAGGGTAPKTGTAPAAAPKK